MVITFDWKNGKAFSCQGKGNFQHTGKVEEVLVLLIFLGVYILDIFSVISKLAVLQKKKQNIEKILKGEKKKMLEWKSREKVETMYYQGSHADWKT